MGTNYYFMTESRKIAHDYFAKKYDWGNEYYDKEYELLDEPYFHYLIHLNKLSCGWKPLFQVHKAFQTWDELKQFYHDHSDDLKIIDEYDEVFTWDEYEKEIMDHAHRKPEPVKWIYTDDVIGAKLGHMYMSTEKCSPEEADLWIPFDHLDYHDTQREARRRYEAWDTYFNESDREFYSHRDPNGLIDWAKGDFS